MNITRRRFLCSSIAAAAAPWFIPAAALGGSGRVAPSERVTLGLIGLKKMGGAHLESLLARGDVQILAVCDVDTVARLAAKKKVEDRYADGTRSGVYSGCEAYNEYETLLARPDIDAVLIATPDHWHAIMAVAACRAGKDVYCEKPLSLTVREGRRMVEAARGYGRVFQTGTQQRSSPEFRRACELVRNGYIGQVTRVRVEVGPPSDDFELPAEPVPPGFDYERWLGPAPWAPFNRLRVGSNYWDGWRKHRDYSGGKMTDWGAHHFDIVQWGLDADGGGPLEATPPAAAGDARPRARWYASQVVGPGCTPDEPSWGLTYRYPGGVTVTKDGTRGIRFEGTEGWVEVDRGYLATAPVSLRSQRLRPRDVHLPRSAGHHDDWIECIRTRRRPISDVEIGCRSATVCHLGNIALWLNRAIRWDAQTEQIVGDAEASRWLDRPKRAPYRL
ncbi:MAG: Gfo/Idh/MocA family oxidoreductase [Phycisphaerae bacterium]|jgi:predicted dehydrogenase